MKMQDITGRRYGRWTVIKFHDAVRYTRATVIRWLCSCDCGTEKIVQGQSLKNGKSVSCGCVRNEAVRQRMTKHGMYKSSEYAAWAHMMDRCRNPRSSEFKNYGGRGIAVCEPWADAAVFLADMGKRPSTKHSLERKKNNLGYSPENCIWATPPEQCNNKRTNRRLRFNGRVQTVAQWAREFKMKEKTLRKRLDLGWTTTDALTMPQSKDKSGWEARRARQSS